MTFESKPPETGEGDDTGVDMDEDVDVDEEANMQPSDNGDTEMRDSDDIGAEGHNDTDMRDHIGHNQSAEDLFKQQARDFYNRDEDTQSHEARSGMDYTSTSMEDVQGSNLVESALPGYWIGDTVNPAHLSIDLSQSRYEWGDGSPPDA